MGGLGMRLGLQRFQHGTAAAPPPPITPPIVTLPAQSAILDTSATVGATLDCRGLSTIWSIEYGLTGSYGSTQAGGTTSVNGAKTVDLSGLPQNTAIYWRFKAVNADGTSYSTAQTFNTFNSELVDYTSGLVTPLSDIEKDNINSFVSNLKSGLGITNLSDTFDDIHLLNSETEEASLRNLAKRAHDYQKVSTPTFTPYSGWKSGGTGRYLKTNYNNSTQAIKYTQNSAHINVYSNTDVGESISVYGGIISNGVMVAPKILFDGYNPTGVYSRINNSSTFIYESDINSIGLYSIVRENSTTVKLYKDGILLATKTANSTALENLEMFALTRNSSSGATGFGQREVGLITVGDKLTLEQVNTVKTAYDTLIANRNLFFFS